MSDKCDKYESLFVFGTDEELAKHLEICEDCQQEHEKMKKTENLVKEAKPYYRRTAPKKLNNNLIKIAAGLTILFLAYFSASNLMMTNNVNNLDLSFAEKESIVSEMGLPTDEYGLLMVY